MKNPIEMLKDIKNLLGVELTGEKIEATKTVEQNSQVILAQLKLENGTILESEDFKVGKEVFILTDDQQVALPIGEYELEDGRTLSITEEGVINSIEVKAEEAEVEQEQEEKMEEGLYPSRQEFDELRSMVETMKQLMESQETEEVQNEEAELKEELSKPASAPIKHNPESKSETRKVLHSQKRGLTTLDIVMNKILNK